MKDGDLIYDNKFKEELVYNASRDKFAVSKEPERFTLVKSRKQYKEDCKKTKDLAHLLGNQ